LITDIYRFNFGGNVCTVEIGMSLKGLNALRRVPVSAKDTLYVYDDNTEGLFAGDIEKITGREEESAAVRVVIDHGEEHKSWESVNRILEKAVESDFGRDCTFMGIGGGVLTDLVAFASSVYMRGSGLILVPTTLLSMVDASIGGKTGFNYHGYKNLIGTFYPAEKVCIAIETLESLPENEFNAGIAEVIKTAMLGDEELFGMLEREKKRLLGRDGELLKEIVGRCVIFKGRLVEEDLRERGKRAFLNLGHTFAHALESSVNFKGILHGEAVAWGLLKALELGAQLNITDYSYMERVKNLLLDYGFPLKYDSIKPARLISAMYGDKKKRKGNLRFILQRSIGDNLIEEGISEELLNRVLSG